MQWNVWSAQALLAPPSTGHVLSLPKGSGHGRSRTYGFQSFIFGIGYLFWENPLAKRSPSAGMNIPSCGRSNLDKPRLAQLPMDHDFRTREGLDDLSIGDQMLRHL